MNWSMCGPEPQIQEKQLTTSSFKNFGARITNIHGMYRLPEGYRFSNVPSDAVVAGVDPNGRVADEHIPARLPWMKQKRRTGIATSYNVSKSLIAIAQTTIAALTLYKSRGDQIERYGYAAFGLTVVPYIIMSILNLLAQIATPDYPMLYMVQSPEMEEARQRGGIFDGVVGALLPTQSLQDLYLARVDQALGDQTFKLEPIDTPLGDAPRASSRAGGSIPRMSFWFGYGFDRPANLVSRGPLPTSHFSNVSFPFRRTPSYRTEADMSHRWWPKRWLWLLQFFISSVSLIVVGCLSGFRSGSESTTAQRAWIMSWLVVSMVAGLYADSTASLFVLNYEMGGDDLFDIVFESFVGFCYWEYSWFPQLEDSWWWGKCFWIMVSVKPCRWFHSTCVNIGRFVHLRLL